MNRTEATVRAPTVTTVTGPKAVQTVVQSPVAITSVATARGLPGPAFDGTALLAIDNALSELADDPQAQAQARANLGITFPDDTLSGIAAIDGALPNA